MKNSILRKFLLSAVSVSTITGLTQAQDTLNTSQLLGGINTITTAVPFLLICPDSRAGGMGEVGVSTSPDVNSTHWNLAKLAFSDKTGGIGISYTPWLRQLVPDINLAYITGYKKLKGDAAIAGSLRYFSLGNITFTDVVGNVTGQFNPNEFAIDIGYARKLGEEFSGSLSLRYINSNLTGGIEVQGAQTKAGQSVAADIGTYWHRELDISDKKSILTIGATITNIGAKISYSETGTKDFIPTNLRFGSGLMMNINDYNSIAFNVEFSKLLVPTPPIYATDTAGNRYIAYGEDPNVGVPKGMIQSFSDAPNGFSEEMQEIIWQLGFEYWYDKQFAFRGGYFHEAANKGNRQFFTVGAGLKYNIFGLDFAYLIPTEQRNPLENTLRFTLTFDFDAKAKKDKSSEE
ncbi:MAG: type IX secretion system outer membrane channel protein PorV [Bacteroidia bacterium]